MRDASIQATLPRGYATIQEIRDQQVGQTIRVKGRISFFIPDMPPPNHRIASYSGVMDITRQGHSDYTIISEDNSTYLAFSGKPLKPLTDICLETTTNNFGAERDLTLLLTLDS